MKKLMTLLFGASLILAACNKDDKSDGPDILSNDLTTGASAREILSGNQYTSILIEVQYPEGYALPSGTAADIESFMADYCHKPDGIEVRTSKLSMPAKSGYTLNDIKQIEKDNRQHYNSEKQLAIYLFLAGGDYVENADTLFTLGISYKNTSMVVFQKTIQRHSGGLGQPSTRLATSAVLQHELGHLMGLVSLAKTASEHEDKDHPHHCNNKDCLMYWSYNGGSGMSNLLGMSQPPKFDQACISDLRVNGGK